LASESNSWSITVSAVGYRDSSYTLEVVKGNNELQDITLILSNSHGCWGGWELVKAADCFEAGQEKRTCVLYDTTQTRAIAKLSGVELDDEHFNSAIDYGFFTDSRAGAGCRVYRTVEIGGKTWFAENLHYSGVGGDVGVCYGTTEESKAENCAKYGRLYTWVEAMVIESKYSSELWSGDDSDHHGVCPAGWRLPSDEDWSDLETAVGSSAGTKLKSVTGWFAGSGYIPGTNESGFSALPGGTRWIGGSFDNVGRWGYWWSATENGAGRARYRSMDWGLSYVYSYWVNKSIGFSVRCLQD
jgi:uncharacterized protein (TIGR02145 family)